MVWTFGSSGERLLGRQRQSADVVALNLLHDRRDMGEGKIDTAGKQIDVHRRRAAIRNVDVVTAGALIEQFGRDMSATASTGRSEPQRRLLRQFHELGHRVGLHGRVHDQDHWEGRDQ
ncbi:MAG: hypothetical protein WDN48_10055 [Pseudolabrys sp.]